MLRKPIALLFTAAFVLALAACGDDGGSLTAPPDSSGGSSGSEAPATTAGGSDATSADSGSADTTAPNFSGSGGDEFCSEAQGFEDTFGSDDFATSTDPAELKDDFSKAEDALDQLEGSAPDEIKADVKTVSDAMSSLIDVFESVNYDFTKLAQDPEALAKLEAFDNDEVQGASDRVEAYLEQVCGISSDGG